MTKSSHETTGLPATARMRSPGRRPDASASEPFSTAPTTAPPNCSGFGTGGGSAQTRNASTTAKTTLPKGPAAATRMRFHHAAGGSGVANSFFSFAGFAGSSSPSFAFFPLPPWMCSMPAGSSCGSAT